MDIFRDIFDWSSRLTLDDIPGATVLRARLQILNMLAAAMEGLRSEHAEEGPDPIWRLTSASMIHDFDDFLYFSHSGHSSVFVPLVLGCIEDASMGDVLAAQVAANEVAGRLGARLLIGPHNGQMWSTTHVPAAIAAAGRLLRIDPDTLSTGPARGPLPPGRADLPLAPASAAGILKKILEHLGLPSSDPPRGPSRFERPDEQVEMFEGWGEEGEARAGRDPPWED
jgi:hypothetical protein